MREYTADVVVVGFGGAGAVSAIEACDSGASVMILEKTEEGGGSTRESAGSLRVLVDKEKAAKHFYALTFGNTPLPVMEAFAQGVTEIPDWITNKGGEVYPRSENREENVLFPHPAPTTSFPNIEGSEGIGGRLRVRSEKDEGAGHALWNVLYKNVKSRNIPTLYGARARKLIRGPEKGVVGVIADDAEGEIRVHAKRAVILTCGGFNYNSEMQRQFIGIELPALSPPGRNTGDGIKMAQDVGADLWHMNAAAVSLGYKVPGYDAAFYSKVSAVGLFVVDQTGKRYVNETALESHSALLATYVIEPIEGKYLRIPSYLIFNEQTRLTSAIVTRTKRSYNQRFPWSSDNSEEIKKGWIKVGNSIAELAEKLALPADALAKTFEKYNRACGSGDDEFGRTPDLMQKLDKPPFYGIALWPALLNTQGGPRRNERGQIIDVFGKPISRLYSAGELGSIWGVLYPGAGNVCECIVFGRISGRNAANESPHS